MAIIAPSFLSSDFLHLQQQCDIINNSEAEWFHLDVMDGRFVPNISFGIPIVEAIRKTTTKVCDVHLMIEEPERYVEAFAKAGADIISVHIEACRHLHRNIQQIKLLGVKAGVAINPHTPVMMLKDVLADVDVVCMMSVNPGFGGQQFIPQTYNKIRELKMLIQSTGSHALIEIDGGVSAANAGAIVHAGADVLVAGSAVFNSPDPAKTISELKHKIAEYTV